MLRALVEQWRGNVADAGERFAGLVAAQNADGGWGWLVGEQSNDFSTGQVLWGLARHDAKPVGLEAAVERGLGHLAASQGLDGWWRVPSAVTSSRSDEAKDYVYVYWGTAWATIGLARWVGSSTEEEI